MTNKSSEPTPENAQPVENGGTAGTTAEVLDGNATAHAAATTATAGSLADCAHDLRTIRRVRVDTVLIGNGRRACDPEQVQMIADSMAQVGLINPITVTTAQTPADVGTSEIGAAVNLVAGLHRLEAHKLLGWTHIDAIVVAGDRIDDRLREIANSCAAANEADGQNAAAFRRACAAALVAVRDKFHAVGVCR